jgi:hypothetical protein
MRTPTLAVAVALFAACGNPVDMKAPDFTGGGQMTTILQAPYQGPYGYGTGSVINNYALEGFPNAVNDTTTLKQIAIADFYNPTGTGTYPAGSPYGAGNPLPKALIIDRAAVWCGPCNMEAKDTLPGKYTQFFPDGQFLLALDEGATPGTGPSQSQLKNWLTSYGAKYPGTLDPQTTFSTIVGADAYPGNIIIRTKDMKIVKWVAGVPDDTFWQTFADTIAGKPVLPGDPTGM